MDEARLPFTMKATVSHGDPPPAPPDQLPSGWVRIPVSFQVMLPAEAVERARQGGAAASGRGPGAPVPVVPGSPRLGAGVPPDDGRAWRDVDALPGASRDEPSPPASPARREDDRPVGAGALNSLGLGAAFGQRVGSRPVGAVGSDSVGGLPPPTPPDAGEANDTAGGGDRPAAGTGGTAGTTGSRALDRVLNAGRIGTPRRAPPLSAEAAGPGDAGDGRASLRPAVERRMAAWRPSGGAGGDTP